MLTDALRFPMQTSLRDTRARLRAARRCAALACAVASLSGCGTGYLLQAARGQYEVLTARRPIDEVVADTRTSETVRLRLEAVREMRAFASHALGLPDNASYRSYVSIERPYVVWNVVATPEFSIEPRRWCYPVVGCLAYRGYFSERKARAFAARLEREGYDVFVGGVAAYSTLGRFADPVLSTMLVYGENELAAMLFHELAHQIVYVPGDTIFNEAFAVAVEQAGLARWLDSRGKPGELTDALQRRARQAEFVALLAKRRAELAALYAEPLPAPEMRARKRGILAGLESDVRTLEARTGMRSAYSDWFARGVNNAHLASVGTYFDCVPAFNDLLKAQGGDLAQFYDAVRALAAPAAHPRREAFCPGGPHDEGEGRPATEMRSQAVRR